MIQNLQRVGCTFIVGQAQAAASDETGQNKLCTKYLLMGLCADYIKG